MTFKFSACTIILLFQFIELYKDKINEEVDLDNFGILVCTYDKGEKKPKYMTIRLAIRLDGSKMARKSHYGLISAEDIGKPLLVPKAPDLKFWRFFSDISPNTIKDWLKIQTDRFIAIFLTYSKNGKLFETFLPQKKGHSLYLDGERLDYAKENTVDSVVLTSPTGALESPLVHEVIGHKFKEYFPELAKFLKMPTTMASPSLPFDLSMSRCGSNQPFSLRLES